VKAILAVTVASLLLTSSHALARSRRESKAYSRLALVTDQARARVNPLEGDPAAPLAGRKLYERHCLECHGVDGESGRKGPSLRAIEVQSASAGALFWVLTNGNVRGGMRWQIVSFVKSLGVADAAVSAPPEPGPVQAH
jgi:mono/diheme cytochrome c family protein